MWKQAEGVTRSRQAVKYLDEFAVAPSYWVSLMKGLKFAFDKP
jgi:hypothetical protein